MLIRPYTKSDLDALRRMHASLGFDYPFPDLSDPIFISKLVLEDDDGRPVMASLARLTCEMYLLVHRSDDNDREDGIRSAGILPANSREPGDDQSRQLEAGATSGRVAEGVLGVQGFSPDIKRRAERGTLLPQAVAEALTPKRQKVGARERWAQLLVLHRAGELDLLARGLDDAHAWLPPPIARRFGRRLESLGWVRDNAWTPYCRILRR